MAMRLGGGPFCCCFGGPLFPFCESSWVTIWDANPIIVEVSALSRFSASRVIVSCGISPNRHGDLMSAARNSSTRASVTYSIKRCECVSMVSCVSMAS